MTLQSSRHRSRNTYGQVVSQRMYIAVTQVSTRSGVECMMHAVLLVWEGKRKE